MKTFWKTLLCRLLGHKWMDYNISGPLFYESNWMCRRCLKVINLGTIGNTNTEANKAAAKNFTELFQKMRHIGSGTIEYKNKED